MKKKSLEKVLLIVFLGVCLSIVGISQKTEDPGVLLRSAIEKEEVDGDLQGAIGIYREIVEKFSGNKALAAKAQLRIGICYEKLGQKKAKLAKEAFQKVIDNYPAQTETADEARRRLAVLLKPLAAGESSELSVRRVWSGHKGITLGAFSPNGRYLSFRKNLNLCVRDLKTGKNRQLTKSGSSKSRVAAEYSIFAPDGSRIAYNWYNNDGISDLRLIGLEDSKPRVLLRRDNGGSIKPLGWSPDGKRILAAFFSEGLQNIMNEIGFVSVQDGSVEIIKSAHRRSSYSSFIEMRLSPDGRHIVCDAPADDEAGQRDIFLLSADGSHEFPLIRHPADDYSPIWTHDGRHILFISDREGNPGIWMAHFVDGKNRGASTLVKADIGQFIKWMGFSHEGACNYAIKTMKQNIYIADFNPLSSDILGKPEALASRFEGSISGPAWSPDGKHLAYFRYDWDKGGSSGASTIIIRSMKTGDEWELPNKLNQSRAIHWFPDGKSLLVSAFRLLKDQDYCLDFYRVDVSNSDTTIILQEANRTLRPGLSPDGKRIFYFCRKKPDETALISYDLESQEKKIVYLPGHNPTMRISICLSPDGRRMAFVEDNGASPLVFTVKVMEVGGGNPRDLLSVKWPELINGARALAWTADGRHLMIIKMIFGSGEKPSGSQQVRFKDELLRIPVEGGSIQKVNLTARVMDSLSIHPNGSLVAYGALSENPPYEIWAMENFLSKEAKENPDEK
jgi:Tol biopolymer transport system component